MHLIDATGPFFKQAGDVTNWSKIPFTQLEEVDSLKAGYADAITKDFDTFCSTVASLGYDGITLDDLAHCVIFPSYPPRLKAKLKEYQDLYSSLVTIARSYDLDVFITSDVMFRHIQAPMWKQPFEVLKNSISSLFTSFSISGIILRIGEADGVDVEGDFRSELLVKNPGDMHRMLSLLLPICEQYRRLLIVRTWTLGAFPIGDLMWNEQTFKKTFMPFQSDRLIISMKYGESDFFRRLETNPLFFATNHKKIIELQARREYDGFGELPFYTGWDYESYRDNLRGARIVGTWVWCQTGGWTKKRRITFLEDSSPWTELNVKTTLRIWKDSAGAEEAAREIVSKDGYDYLSRYYELSDRLIFPTKTPAAYLRRLRLPPQYWLFWDFVLLSDHIRYLYKDYDFPIVTPSEIDDLMVLGRECDAENAIFVRDTLRFFYFCRNWIIGIKTNEAEEEIKGFQNNYPDSYTVWSDTRPMPRSQRKILDRLLRDSRQYRFTDKIMMMDWFSSRMRRTLEKAPLPPFANKMAMPLKTIFS